MTRRTIAYEPKYYDFEIALTVDPTHHHSEKHRLAFQRWAIR